MKHKDKTFTQEDSNKKSSNVSPFEQYKPEWIKLSDVQAKEQPWFWPGVIPFETLTLFAGQGSIGKSLLLLYLCAKTSSGQSFFAGGLNHQLLEGSVILLSAEDDCEYQIKPKLIAANANLEKIHFLKSKIGEKSGKKKFIELDRDIYILEEKLKENPDTKLLIIDPIQYFLGEIRDHYNPEVANFLQSLIDLSKTYHLTIILNKHLRKKASGTKNILSAVDEVGGAGAWTNSPRKCWLITNYHEDKDIKVITQLKDNLSKKSTESLAYKIEPKIIIDNELTIKTTEVVWLDKLIDMSSDQAVDKNSYEMSKLDAAIEYIYNYLMKNGQSLLRSIEDNMCNSGYSRATFLRAYPEFEKRYSDQLKIEKGVRGAKMYLLINSTC